MVTLLQTSSQTTEGKAPLQKTLPTMARLFYLPNLWLSLGPLRSFSPGFLQLHVANGKWANPEVLHVLPFPPAKQMSMSRTTQETICGYGEQSTTCPPPGLHPTRNCLYEVIKTSRFSLYNN